MSGIIQQIIDKITHSRSTADLALQKIEVPFYAEDWGEIEFGGQTVRRGLIDVIIPDKSSILHGIEIQIHRYGDYLRASVYFCPKPPAGLDQLSRALTKEGYKLTGIGGCPLGKRLEFFQNHLSRGFAGSGPEIEFKASPDNMRLFIERIGRSSRLIPDASVRKSVEEFLASLLNKGN